MRVGRKGKGQEGREWRGGSEGRERERKGREGREGGKEGSYIKHTISDNVNSSNHKALVDSTQKVQPPRCCTHHYVWQPHVFYLI